MAAAAAVLLLAAACSNSSKSSSGTTLMTATAGSAGSSVTGSTAGETIKSRPQPDGMGYGDIPRPSGQQNPLQHGLVATDLQGAALLGD
jgi:hypothetical protein